MGSEFAAGEREISIHTGIAGKLWPFIRPYGLVLLITTLLVFAVTFFELAMPVFTQKAFDGFILAGSGGHTSIFGIKIESFRAFSLVFACFILSLFVVDFVQSLFMEYTGQKIILDLRCRLFAHMTALPVAFYDRNSSGRMVSRVAGDVENMNEMFTSVLIFIFRDIAMMAGILVILFCIDIRLGCFLSCLVPLIIISVVLFSRVLRKSFRLIRKKMAQINHSLAEAVSGIRIIQTSSSRHRFVRRFEQLNFSLFTATLFQIRMFSIFMPFIGFLGVVSTALIIWAGSFDVVRHNMTLGELVAFLSYMKLFFRPLRELSEKFNLLQNALASAERIIDIFDEVPAEQSAAGHRNHIDRIHELQFDRVWFSYDKKFHVLEDISFHIKKGSSTGIVGRTGSGKTSIANLIAGFYSPDRGRILFNGIDQASINITEIRARTALVMQDSLLFSGTVRENIMPPDRQCEDSWLEKALENANCRFLSEKFFGLDTVIEQGGSPLSSGEKQLVCIARAFAFDPDLIIFDEATSYMDSRSESLVHAALKNLMKGRLSIIIAHRLSTIRNCDSIIVLRDGVIREQGTHNELAGLKGEYYHLLEKEKLLKPSVR